MSIAPTGSNAAAVRLGVELTFETLGEEYAPPRLHQAEDALLRVIDGIVRLASEGAERLLGPGDEAIVPAGSEYRLVSAGGSARVLLGFRAA